MHLLTAAVIVGESAFRLIFSFTGSGESSPTRQEQYWSAAGAPTCCEAVFMQPSLKDFGHASLKLLSKLADIWSQAASESSAPVVSVIANRFTAIVPSLRHPRHTGRASTEAPPRVRDALSVRRRRGRSVQPAHLRLDLVAQPDGGRAF